MTEGAERAAIYARVSTSKQEAENQLRELRGFCERRGWSLVREFTDEAVRGRADHKPQLEAMLDAAHRREFDVVVFWSLDRLTRKGPDDAAAILGRIQASGCDFISYREGALTSLGPWGRVVIDILAIVANFESTRMGERIKAGIAERRAEAEKAGETFLWGQARKSKLREDPELPSKVKALRDGGRSWSQIAATLRLPLGTCRRYYGYATGAKRPCLLDRAVGDGGHREGPKAD